MPETHDNRSKKIKAVFSNLPCMETPRLILRKIVVSDYMDMYEYSRDSGVTRYLTWHPHKSPDETLAYVESLQKRYNDGKFYDWGIELRENGKFVGTCGFTTIHVGQNKAEIGYVLAKPYWGQGIVPEAVVHVMRFGFMELGFNKIEARFMDGNVKSGRVMKKCGMTFEKTLFDAFHIKNEYKTVHTYSITREEFINKFGLEEQKE